MDEEKLTVKEKILLGIIAGMFLLSFFWSATGVIEIKKLKIALSEKCDTWNIALGKEQADGSMDVQYVRVCKEDYESLSTIIGK